MEMRRNLNSNMPLYCLCAIVASFIFGYILPFSLDHVKSLTLFDCFFSVYTVITQFGPMVFSVIAIYAINIDYKEKNILFYQSLGYKPLKYFIFRIFPICLDLTGSLLIATIGMCALYRDFSCFWILFAYFELALISEIFIASLFSFLFKNILAAFCINLVVWILQIIISTGSKLFSFLAYFDASNQLYKDLDRYLIGGNPNFLHLGQSLLYDFLLFLIVIAIVEIFRKRWIKNGV